MSKLCFLRPHVSTAISIAILFTLPAAGQSITPQVITSAANYITGSNGSLSFTIGETVVGSYTSASGGSLAQGFQPNLDASNPLPLDFLSFTAKLVAGKTELEWITTQEINTDYFVVERSTDGANFNPIATVPAVKPASTGSDNTYQATDSLPLPGTDNYRIKEVDQNGQATYSPIVSVKISEGLSCMVYPNPAIDQLFIRINSHDARPATIVIYDLRGQLIRSQPIRLTSGENQFEIDLTGKAKGMYIVKILGIDGLPAYSILKN
jgi:Secretion system C-terminal sorting domain